MITRAQPPCRIPPRIPAKMVLLVGLRSGRQRKVHKMGNGSSSFPATGRLHSRLCNVNCQSYLKKKAEHRFGFGIRIQQQHPHLQAEVAFGPCAAFEETGCSSQQRTLNETYVLRQSFLSFRHVFACSSLFQERSSSGIVRGKVFGMEGTRSWKWPKRALGLSTSRPNYNGYTEDQVQRSRTKNQRTWLYYSRSTPRGWALLTERGAR